MVPVYETVDHEFALDCLNGADDAKVRRRQETTNGIINTLASSNSDP